MSILLSVIVPVYNTQRHLESCVASILLQSVNKMEVIIVNDGSTDNSSEICNKLAASDKRIKVVHQNNLGLSAARNTGIGISRGRYITFVDSDDVILENTYVKNLKLMLEDESIDVICFPYIYPYNKNKHEKGAERILRFKDKRSFLLNHLNNNVNHAVWNKIFKKQIFENIRFPEGRFFEDTYLLNVLSRMGLCYYCSGVGAYGYNLWNGSIMNSAVSSKKVIDRTIAYARFLSEACLDEYIANNKYYTEAYHYTLLYLYNLKKTSVIGDNEFAIMYDKFNDLPLSVFSILISKISLKEKLRLLCCKYFGVKRILQISIG